MVTEKISNLLSEYFDLAFAEGKEGRNHDTEAGDAQRVLSELESAIAALSTDAEPVKPYGYLYESTTRYFDGRGPQRKVDFFYTKKNISDDDIEEFEISETAVYDRPPQPAPSVAVKASQDGYTCDQCGHVISHDAIVPNDVWEKISPSNDCNGVLCANCMVEKLGYAAALISDAHAAALSAQVQDVAGLERLRDVTYAVQHNPNCTAEYLVRLVGKSGSIDFKNHGQAFSMVKHETGDILGFGKTIDEAIDSALAAAAPAAKLEEKP